MSMDLGEGSNNFVEIMSLKLMLVFALEKNCRSISIFGDSLNVINWYWEIQQCGNISLANILGNIKDIQSSFDFVSCRHLYREKNKEVDKASKDGLRLEWGFWHIKEFDNGRIQEFFHEPFAT